MSRRAVIVGSGPNGLVAAICLARAGYSVEILEAGATIGGGMRTEELTLPGFKHDICSAVHPMARLSPILQEFPLEKFGLNWIYPELPLAHALDENRAAFLSHSMEETVSGLGADGTRYRRLIKPLLSGVEKWLGEVLAPFHRPRNAVALAQFGLRGGFPATLLARIFETEKAKAVFAGNAAHSVLPLHQPLTSAVAILLMVAAHHVGWPIAEGGSQQIANALGAYFLSLGGSIRTGICVCSLKELPGDAVKVFDVSPSTLEAIGGDAFTPRYRKQLKNYRYGPGVFKIDWALSEPIPWRAKACRRAGTVHIGGNFEEVAAWENGCWTGSLAGAPFVFVAQQSLFDHSRAPGGCHTGWAYCHVPNGSDWDMTSAIESRIEKFAPGFSQAILARHVMSPRAMEEHNANYRGGDVIGGVMDLRQLYARPVSFLRPYATEMPGVFICSASTPPGGGVHGMCGYHAANAILVT